MTKTKTKLELRLAAAAALLAVPLLAFAAEASAPRCPGPQDGASCPHAAACQKDGGCQGCAHGQGQGCMHAGAHRHGGGMAARWDPGAVAQVQGTVESVDAAGAGGHGTHLVLAVGSDRLTVVVGPSAWLAAQGLTLAKGDAVEVKGMRVERGDGTSLVAQELRKGDRAVTLREADGTPRWAPRAP